MRPLIVYHGNCPDGAGAALAAYERFGDDALYVPGFYDGAPPRMERGQTVYLVDFSWPRKDIEAARIAGNRIVVIDHHETAQARLSGLLDCVFDMDHSGAVLTWTYFHPEKEVPELLRYIEDRDLWRFKLPHSKEVSAALKAQGAVNDFMKLKPLLDDWKSDGDDGIPQGSKRLLIAEGKAIRRSEEAMVVAQLETSSVTDWEGNRTAIVNASVLFSEVAEAAYKKHETKVGAYFFFDHKRAIWQVGLRSPADGPNVAEIATKYAGGGHAHAAGFNCKSLPWAK